MPLELQQVPGGPRAASATCRPPWTCACAVRRARCAAASATGDVVAVLDLAHGARRPPSVSTRRPSRCACRSASRSCRSRRPPIAMAFEPLGDARRCRSCRRSTAGRRPASSSGPGRPIRGRVEVVGPESAVKRVTRSADGAGVRRRARRSRCQADRQPRAARSVACGSKDGAIRDR